MALRGPFRAKAYRAFDFWIGSWDVETLDGKPAGKNRIEVLHGGAALQENWRGAGGSEGTSLNAYHAPSESWHQTWVDGSGLVLRLDGGLDDRGRMVLEGERTGPDGALVIDQITWTPREDGSVRQTWRTRPKDAEAQEWQTLADLIYRPSEQ